MAILGTRGIPNNYGGFEQFAEYLSTGLVNQGFQVTVYNPHFHPYRDNTFKGVDIVRIYCPETSLGGWANFIYDFLSLWHAYKKKFDIVYELGYGSSAISFMLLRLIKPRRSLLVTNMDGLEWKRTKWNSAIKWFTKRSERVALNLSDIVISDNIGIQNYYNRQYGKQTVFFPYGAEVVSTFDPDYLKKYDVSPYQYFLIIARLEPENNIDLMIQSYLESRVEQPLLIIGNVNNSYAKKTQDRYKLGKVIFLGGIYDKGTIDSLRHYTKFYLHGHSVGGTNPSLLEAMACSCLIVAHDNEFNKSVMGEAGLYFENKEQLITIFKKITEAFPDRHRMIEENINKIDIVYKWGKITKDYGDFFRKSLNR